MGAGAEAVLQVVMRLRNQMREELTGVQGQLQGLAAKAGLVGAGLTAGVTLPLVGIAKQAIQTAASFESQMNVLTVAARASGTSLEDLSQAALLVGKDTQLVGINSAQAADAMTNFYKAGLDTADIFGGQLNNYLQTGTNLTGALRSAIDLAAASELDLNQASMLTASSMATFGLNASDTTRIANAFVGAADASLASVGDLYAAMQNVGPTAAQFGWSIEETNTALAILSTRGIMGAEAGTALKSMMTNLMSNTKETRTALNDLNISLYDAQGNMLPLPNIIGQLSKSMAGMTEEQRNQYVQTLAGTYGMKAMNTLLAEGVPGWENMAQAVADAATAAEVGAARTQGLRAAWEQLQGALETLYITVGLPLIQSFLTPLVQRVTDVISGLVELNPNVQRAALAFAAVFAAAGPIALMVAGIATALAFLISPLGLVITGVAALAAAFAGDFMGIRSHVQTVSGHIQNFVQTILQDVVPAVSGSIGQIVQTFVTLLPKIQSTVVTIFGTVQTTIQTILQDVVPAVSGYVGQIVQAFVNVLPQILDTVSLVFDSLRLVIETALRNVLPILISFVQDAVNTFAHLLPQIITTVSGILNGLANVVSSILGVISQFVANHGEEIQTFFSRAWQQIQRIISMALEIINATIVPLLNGIAQFIRTHSDDIQAILGTLWSSVTAVIQGALRIIEDVVRTVLAVIKGDWQTAWESVVDIAVTIFQTIAKVIGDAYDFLNALTGGWIGKIIQWFQDLYHKLVGGSIIPDMVREILQWFTRLGSEIGKTVVAIKDEMVKRWEEIKTAIGREVNNILTNVGKFLDDVRNKIKGYDLKGAAAASWQTVLAGISEKAAQALTNVAKFLTDAAGKIKSYSFKSATLTALQTVVAGIMEKAAAVLSAIGNLLNNVSAAVRSFSLADAGRALIQGMIGGITSMAGALVNAARGVVSNAVQAAKNLLQIKSPSKVFEEIGINVVEGLIVGIDEKKAEAARKTAEAVAGIVTAAVEAADALRAFRPVDNVGVITAQIREFLIGAEAQFADLIAQTDEKLAKQAELFGQAAGAVVELVGNAVEVLNRLRDYEMLHGLQAAINNIAHWIKQMAHTMAAIATEVDTDAQEAARALAEAAGPVVDIFGGALETIEALGQWAGLHGLQAAINNIAHWIKMLTHTMAAIATEIADDGLAAAKAFADAAGPVVDTFGGALETIESIGQWKGLHGLQGNINNIAHWLRVIVQTLGVVGQIVGVELQAAARTFAENVGPVVGMIEGGLKGIAALATFDTFLDAGQFISNLGVFATMLNILTARLAQAADQLSDETRAAAAKFAAHIGPVTKDIETGLKGVAALATFDTFTLAPAGQPAASSTALDAGKFISNIDVFRTMLNILTAKLAEVADRISDETRAAARKFAESIGPLTKDLETGLKGVAALATFDTFLDGGRFIANLDVFTTMLNILAGKLAQAADRLSDETRARAKAFAESAAAIAGSTKEGLATLVSLAQEGVAQAEGFAVAAESIGAALARGMAVLQGNPGEGPLSLIEVMAQLVRAVGSAVALIRASFDELVGAAYGAGYDWAAQLAAGILAGVPLVTAAVQAVADLFPHSPAKAGPLRREPDWRKFLLGGLLPVAGEVGRALAGVGAGVGTPATFEALPVGGPAVAPVAISSGGATVIKFTYAPALSLASQREAEEQIAPVLARVLAREGRRR